MYNYYGLDNSFMGYYVSSYEQVLNMAVPTNGQAVLFADLDKGKIYSKKIMNGSSYIQEYDIRPVNNTSGDLFKRLEEMEKELKALKGGVNDERSRTNASDTTKNEKSTGI